MPRSVQLKPEQKKVIKALLPRNGFSSQKALVEHLGLSRDTVSRFLNGKPVDRLNAEEICTALGCDVREVTFVEDTEPKQIKTDWGEGTDNFDLSGRQEELKTLEEWIVKDRCRIILIQGMRGMGKTNLSYKLAKQIQSYFDYVIWRSLDQYRSIDELLKDWLSFLYDDEDIQGLDTTDKKLEKLVHKLNLSRCLLILANVDWLLNNCSFSSDQKYCKLLKWIAEKQDQSCLVMTSDIEPKEISLWVQQNKGTRYRTIDALSIEAIKHLFSSIGSFSGSEENWKQLRETYKGNPLVLVNVANNIWKNFDGNITDFIQFGNFVFNGIEEFVEEQVENLSEKEKDVIYWLAIYRHSINLFELKDILSGLFGDQLLTIIKHLKLRFFVKSNAEGVLFMTFMIRDYLIKKLINEITQEIFNNNFYFLTRFPLFLPAAKATIRQDQENFILKPIIEKLKTEFNTDHKVESHLKELLHQHQNNKSDKYTGGNLVNLLRNLITKLDNQDFSNLVLKNANFREVTLHDSNFTGADLSNSMFLNGFSNVISVAFSPDGKWLAIGDTNDQIYLWEVTESRPILRHIINTNNFWVRTIVFSPDSKIIASGGEDGNVHLWEVKTARSITTFSGHLDRIRCLTFTDDNQFLMSSSDDQTIRIWDLNRNELIHVLTQHQDKVIWVIFNPVKQILISASQDYHICIWQVNSSSVNLMTTFSVRDNIKEQGSILRAVAVSPDGKIIASGSDDGVVNFWDLETGQFKQSLENKHNHWIRSLAFSPNGDKLASASEDTTICITDVKTGKHLHTLRGNNGGVWSIAFHPGRSWLVSGNMGLQIKIWNFESGQCLRSYQGYSQEIRPITYSPDGQILAMATNQKIVYLKDSSDGNIKAKIFNYGGNIWSIAYSPDGQILIGGSDDTKLYVWNTFNNNSILKSLSGHKNWIRTVAYSPDGKFIATGSDDKTVKLWDAYTYKLLQTYEGHTDWIHCISFHPNKPLLISGSDDGTIKFWNTNNPKKDKQLNKIYKSDQRQIWTIAISPDGKLMASGSKDNTIYIWDLESDNTQPIKIITAHRNWVSSVAFSPDNQWLASGSYDTSIRLWELSSGEYYCDKILQGHGNAVISVTFHPHESILASSSKDGSIKRWNYLTGQCLSTWRSPRPYENMNITRVTGLTEAQKSALKTLGAVEMF